MIPEAGAETTLTVSIVLHDSPLDDLATTLRSLSTSLQSAQRAALLRAARLVILDNRSSPDYSAKLAPFIARQLTGWVAQGSEGSLVYALRFATRNRGFGAGHNAALAAADSDYCLILNPDVELAQDALGQALAVLEKHPGAVAANPHCERADGSREYLCKRYPSLLDLMLRGSGSDSLKRRFSQRLARYEYRDLHQAGPQPVRLLSGACLLCRTSAFRRSGGFNPRYFMYFEDFELSLRLAEQGELLYLPDMRIVHRGGFAARKGRQHIRWFVTSALRFFAGNGWRVL